VEITLGAKFTWQMEITLGATFTW